MVAVAIVAALIVLVILAGALLRVIWARHADLRAAERRLQSEWLAESGLDRALSRLAADPGYRGETWIVPADDLGGHDGAAVRIEITAAPGPPGHRAIRAVADYPVAEPRRARQSRTLTIDIPSDAKPKPIPDRKGDAPK
jgi:hypothetical protein